MRNKFVKINNFVKNKNFKFQITSGSSNITEDIELKKLDLQKKSWDLHNLMSVALGDSFVKLKVDTVSSEVQSVNKFLN